MSTATSFGAVRIQSRKWGAAVQGGRNVARSPFDQPRRAGSASPAGVRASRRSGRRVALAGRDGASPMDQAYVLRREGLRDGPDPASRPSSSRCPAHSALQRDTQLRSSRRRRSQRGKLGRELVHQGLTFPGDGAIFIFHQPRDASSTSPLFSAKPPAALMWKGPSPSTPTGTVTLTPSVGAPARSPKCSPGARLPRTCPVQPESHTLSARTRPQSADIAGASAGPAGAGLCCRSARCLR